MLISIQQYYGQREEAWKLKRLGFSTSTIGSFGCTIATIGSIIGKTPDQVNDDFKAGKCFTGSNGSENLVNWAKVPEVYSQFGWEGKVDYDNVLTPLTEIDGYLAQGKPVIIRVESDEIGIAKGSHFLLVVGKEKDDYRVFDPWTKDVIILGSRYSHKGSNKPENVILGIRKLVLKQGLPISVDKTEYWYESGNENEDPAILREHRDRNWNLYQEASEKLKNLPNIQGQLDAMRQFKEDVAFHLKGVDKEDTIKILGRIDALLAKEIQHTDWDENFITPAWETLMPIKELELTKKEPKVLSFAIVTLLGLYRSTKNKLDSLLVASNDVNEAKENTTGSVDGQKGGENLWKKILNWIGQVFGKR